MKKLLLIILLLSNNVFAEDAYQEFYDANASFAEGLVAGVVGIVSGDLADKVLDLPSAKTYPNIATTGEIVGVSTTLISGGIAVNAAKIDTLTKMGKAADEVKDAAAAATEAWKQAEKTAKTIEKILMLKHTFLIKGKITNEAYLG